MTFREPTPANAVLARQQRGSVGRQDGKATDLIEQAVHETLDYYAFPDIHW